MSNMRAHVAVEAVCLGSAPCLQGVGIGFSGLQSKQPRSGFSTTPFKPSPRSRGTKNQGSFGVPIVVEQCFSERFELYQTTRAHLATGLRIAHLRLQCVSNSRDHGSVWELFTFWLSPSAPRIYQNCCSLLIVHKLLTPALMKTRKLQRVSSRPKLSIIVTLRL